MRMRSVVPLRLFAVLAALTLALAGSVVSAQIADAAPGAGYSMKAGKNGGVAGWVSRDVLDNRFEKLPPKVQKALAGVPRKGAVQMRSAFKCQYDVCLNVEGEDLIVDRWETTAEQLGSMACTSAFFEYRVPGGNAVFYEGQFLCPTAADGVFYDTTGPTGYFPDGTELCNTWDNKSGRPCAEVHD